ncbi:MAG: methyl-accepting chemotaxis protein [Pirellulaceae bacterium]
MNISSSENAAIELNTKAKTLFDKRMRQVRVRGDRFMQIAMVLQFFGCLLTAIVVSPRTWEGETGVIHIHVWAAIIIGGLSTLFPAVYSFFNTGARTNKYVMSIGQAVICGTFIHISGGRIEAHFHIFVAMAILAMYRNTNILVVFAGIVAADHVVRGLAFPYSIYGIDRPTLFRSLEHGAVVVVEVFALWVAISQSLREMKLISKQQIEIDDHYKCLQHDINAIGSLVDKISSGDLTQSGSGQKLSEELVNSLSIKLNTMIDELRGIVGDIENGSVKVDDSATQFASTAEQIAETSHRTNDSMKDMIGSLESLLCSIEDVRACALNAHHNIEMTNDQIQKGVES